MKRALAALGTFAVITLGILFDTGPASAAICIQGTTGCAPAISHGAPDGMPYDGRGTLH